MAEDGIDLDGQYPKHLKEYLGQIPVSHLVIVCSGANESCPRIWPGMSERLNWPFDDPASFQGSGLETLAEFRRVRDEIKQRILAWNGRRFVIMQVQQLLYHLDANSESSLRIMLPTGIPIPDHFHITEVGRIDKNFIDCGGTQRRSATCLLQAWTANDIQHRLVAGKLAKILRIAEPVLGTGDLPVEVEYGVDLAAQYVVSDIEVQDLRLTLRLIGKQTDCLARDQCGVGECNTSGCCS